MDSVTSGKSIETLCRDIATFAHWAGGTVSYRVWSAYQCGRHQRALSEKGAEIGQSLQGMIALNQDIFGKLSRRALRMHLMLYQVLCSRGVTTYAECADLVSSYGWTSLNQCQLDLGIRKESPAPTLQTPGVRVGDFEVPFLRRSGHQNSPYLFRVSLLAGGREEVSARIEISMETSDPDEAAKRRDFLMRSLAKVGLLCDRARGKWEKLLKEQEACHA